MFNLFKACLSFILIMAMTIFIGNQLTGQPNPMTGTPLTQVQVGVMLVTIVSSVFLTVTFFVSKFNKSKNSTS